MAAGLVERRVLGARTPCSRFRAADGPLELPVTRLAISLARCRSASDIVRLARSWRRVLSSALRLVAVARLRSTRLVTARWASPAPAAVPVASAALAVLFAARQWASVLYTSAPGLPPRRIANCQALAASEHLTFLVLERFPNRLERFFGWSGPDGPCGPDGRCGPRGGLGITNRLSWLLLVVALRRPHWPAVYASD